MASADPQQVTRSPRVVSRLRTLVPSLVASFVIPVAVYFLLRPHVGSDAIALAIGGALPAAWTAARLAWYRRLDPIGVIAVLSFGVELLVTVLSGGNALALKLHEAPLTGAVGFACLVSVAVRRPLLPTVLKLFGRSGQATIRRAAAATVVVGATFLTDAVTRVVLAVTLPTSTFLVVSREVSWAILGVGLVLLWRIRRLGRP
jgi:hypothetical protein